ncbi:MAG: hypothetical protein IME98_03085 [Proteobacteria bacterium]|nr:hypothetical protein [Pseudomonadota bacterium]
MSNERTNWARDFFESVEPIKLLDPLGEILGAVKEGEPFVYNYSDAVLMAGHSCPAVSGAFAITRKALKALYADETPVRGDIKVLIKGKPEELAYGPQSQVIMLITGASGDTGFKGLGGQYGRNNRLFFDQNETEFNTYIFGRMDTGKAVKLVYNPQALPDIPELNTLTPLVISKAANAEEKEEFQRLWQGKVKSILTDEDKYPGLIEITELTDFSFPG